LTIWRGWKSGFLGRGLIADEVDAAALHILSGGRRGAVLSVGTILFFDGRRCFQFGAANWSRRYRDNLGLIPDQKVNNDPIVLHIPLLRL
jgi:hypothetical protein